MISVVERSPLATQAESLNARLPFLMSPLTGLSEVFRPHDRGRHGMFDSRPDF